MNRRGCNASLNFFICLSFDNYVARQSSEVAGAAGRQKTFYRSFMQKTGLFASGVYIVSYFFNSINEKHTGQALQL